MATFQSLQPERSTSPLLKAHMPCSNQNNLTRKHSPWTASKNRKKTRQDCFDDDEADHMSYPEGACASAADVSMITDGFKSLRVFRRASGAKGSAALKMKSSGAQTVFGAVPEYASYTNGVMPSGHSDPALHVTSLPHSFSDQHQKQAGHHHTSSSTQQQPQHHPLAASFSFSDNSHHHSSLASAFGSSFQAQPAATSSVHLQHLSTFGQPAVVGRSCEVHRDILRPHVDMSSLSTEGIEAYNTHSAERSSPEQQPASQSAGSAQAAAGGASCQLPSWASLVPGQQSQQLRHAPRLQHAASLITAASISAATGISAATSPGYASAYVPDNSGKGPGLLSGHIDSDAADVDTHPRDMTAGRDGMSPEPHQVPGHVVLNAEQDLGEHTYFTLLCDRDQGDAWDDEFRIQTRPLRDLDEPDHEHNGDRLNSHHQLHAGTPRQASNNGAFPFMGLFTPRAPSGQCIATPAATIRTGFTTCDSNPGYATTHGGSRQASTFGNAEMSCGMEVRQYGRAGYCSDATTGTPARPKAFRRAATPAGKLLGRVFPESDEENEDPENEHCMQTTQPPTCDKVKCPDSTGKPGKAGSGLLKAVVKALSRIQDVLPHTPLTRGKERSDGGCSDTGMRISDGGSGPDAHVDSVLRPIQQNVQPTPVRRSAGGSILDAFNAVCRWNGRAEQGAQHGHRSRQQEESELANLMCDECDFVTPSKPGVPAWQVALGARRHNGAHTLGQATPNNTTGMVIDHAKPAAVISQQGTPTLGAGARTRSQGPGQAASNGNVRGSYEHSFSFGMNNTMSARVAANADSPCMYGSSGAMGGVCGSFGAWGCGDRQDDYHNDDGHDQNERFSLRTRSSQGAEAALEEWGSGPLPVTALESLSEFNTQMSLAAERGDGEHAQRLWFEMRSKTVQPDMRTLNMLMRCLSRGLIEPDAAEALMVEVCNMGDLQPNGTTLQLLSEIHMRWEQLQAR